MGLSIIGTCTFIEVVNTLLIKALQNLSQSKMEHVNTSEVIDTDFDIHCANFF